MSHRLQALHRFAAAAALLIAAGASQADDVVRHVVDYGTPGLPYSVSFGQTFLAPSLADRLYDDYAFSIETATFSSIAATFNLGDTLSISNVQLRLIAGDPWSGPLPGSLGALDLAARTAATIATGSGDGAVESIAPLMLMPGNYYLEVSMVVDGSAGGSYGGVLNLVPVPEAPGLPMALAGLAALGLLARRRA